MEFPNQLTPELTPKRANFRVADDSPTVLVSGLGISCGSVLFFGRLPIEKDVDRLGRGIFELGDDEDWLR